MQHRDAEFGFEIGFVCVIGEFICDTPLHKGQRSVTMAINFGTKIATNAYKYISTSGNENVITVSTADGQ